MSRELYLHDMGGERGPEALEALVDALDRENAELRERIVALSGELGRLRARSAVIEGETGGAAAEQRAEVVAAELAAERAHAGELRRRVEALGDQLEDLERERAEGQSRATRAEELLAAEQRRAGGLEATIRLVSGSRRTVGGPRPGSELADERERHAATRLELERVSERLALRSGQLAALRASRAYRLLRVSWALRARVKRVLFRAPAGAGRGQRSPD